MTKYHVATSIPHSFIIEILDNANEFGWVCWGRIPDDLFLDNPTLSRISRGPRFHHVVWMNRPGPFQILELVSGLEWGCAALVELLDHSTRLIEVFVDDAFGTTPEFLTDPRHSARAGRVMHENLHLARGEGVSRLHRQMGRSLDAVPTSVSAGK